MRHLSLALAALVLALPTLLSLLGAGPAAAAGLDDLMRGCGLKYSGPDSAGVYQVAFDGRNVPLIVVRIALVGEGAAQAVCAVSRVMKVDQATQWDPAVFPWLLERTGELTHGSFALTDEGRQVIYLDRLLPAGLDGPTLKRQLSLAVLTVDDLYPRLKSYRRE